MQPQHARYEQIDLLRGLAALCVLASHYTSYSLETLGSTPLHVPREYGFYAVKLFFVISGFVIFMTLERSDTVATFLRARFARLYPAYFVSLTIMVALGVRFFGETMWWGGYLANATMLQAFIGFKNIDHVYWSLAVEIAFYMNMALIFACGQLRRIEAIGLVWMLSACAWFAAKRHLGWQPPEWLELALMFEFVALFVLGMMFYRGLHHGFTWQRLMLMASALACEGYVGGEGLAFVPALVATLLVALALAGRLRLLVNGFTLWLGAISYSLYITHRNLGYSVLYRLAQAGIPVPVAQVLTLALALAVAAVLHHAVEKPSERAIKHWFRRGSGGGAVR